MTTAIVATVYFYFKSEKDSMQQCGDEEDKHRGEEKDEEQHDHEHIVYHKSDTERKKIKNLNDHRDCIH